MFYDSTAAVSVSETPLIQGELTEHRLCVSDRQGSLFSYLITFNYLQIPINRPF